MERRYPATPAAAPPAIVRSRVVQQLRLRARCFPKCPILDLPRTRLEDIVNQLSVTGVVLTVTRLGRPG